MESIHNINKKEGFWVTFLILVFYLKLNTFSDESKECNLFSNFMKKEKRKKTLISTLTLIINL